MSMPAIHKILATSALCLAAMGLSSCSPCPFAELSGNMATEWQNYYPEEAAVVQGCVSEMKADSDESSVLYAYFAADSKIAYIEESFSTSTVAVCVRYLFDESGDFVAAACRISTQSLFSDEWTHSQKLLVHNQYLKVEQCGISEAVADRAKRIMKLCLADLATQSPKIQK